MKISKEVSKQAKPVVQPAAVQPQPVAAVAPISDAIRSVAATRQAGETGHVAAPSTPSKQDQTIAALKAAWLEKKIDLSKLIVKDDGKFKLLIVDQGWPTVQVGASGGIVVLELRSYTKAFDAAINGKELFEKQNARDQKKATAAQPPAPAPAKEKVQASA